MSEQKKKSKSSQQQAKIKEAIKQPPGFAKYYDSYLKEYLEKMIDKGKAPMIINVGDTGDGKSATSLLIANYMFYYMQGRQMKAEELERYMYFDVVKFGRNMLKRNEYRKVFIIEEAGTSLNAREWWNAFNDLFSKIQQTQRIRNCLYILNLPHANFLDKNHMYFIKAIIRKAHKKWATVYFVKCDHANLVGNFMYRKTAEHLAELPLPREDLWEKYKELDAKNKREGLEDWVGKAERKIKEKAKEEEDPEQGIKDLLKSVDI